MFEDTNALLKKTLGEDSFEFEKLRSSIKAFEQELTGKPVNRRTG
jgi:hypothetical protein